MQIALEQATWVGGMPTREGVNQLRATCARTLRRPVGEAPHQRRTTPALPHQRWRPPTVYQPPPSAPIGLDSLVKSQGRLYGEIGDGSRKDTTPGIKQEMFRARSPHQVEQFRE